MARTLSASPGKGERGRGPRHPRRRVHRSPARPPGRGVVGGNHSGYGRAGRLPARAPPGIAHRSSVPASTETNRPAGLSTAGTGAPWPMHPGRRSAGPASRTGSSFGTRTSTRDRNGLPDPGRPSCGRVATATPEGKRPSSRTAGSGPGPDRGDGRHDRRRRRGRRPARRGDGPRATRTRGSPLRVVPSRAGASVDEVGPPRTRPVPRPGRRAQRVRRDRSDSHRSGRPRPGAIRRGVELVGRHDWTCSQRFGDDRRDDGYGMSTAPTRRGCSRR